MKLDHQELLFEGHNYFNTIPKFKSDELVFRIDDPHVSKYSPMEISMAVVAMLPEGVHDEIIGLIKDHVRYPSDKYDISPIHKKVHIVRVWPQMRGVKKDSPEWDRRVKAGVAEVRQMMDETGIEDVTAQLNNAIDRLIKQNNTGIYENAMEAMTGDSGKGWMLKKSLELRKEVTAIKKLREELSAAKKAHQAALNKSLLEEMIDESWVVNDRPMPDAFKAELEGRLIAKSAFAESVFGRF